MKRCAAFTLMLVVMAMLVACSSEETSQQSQQPPEEEPTKREETTAIATVEETTVHEEAAVGLGEEANLGEFSVRVFAVRSEQIAYYYPGPDGSASSEENSSGEYVAVDYVAQSDSDSSLTMDAQATLEDTQGNTYEQDDSIDPPGGSLDGMELEPEGKAASTMFFEVPSGTAPERLTIRSGEEEAEVDLTLKRREEIPPEDYLHVYNLRFNERAYEEIYGMLDPASTQGITLGDWLSYFEPIWGQWYLALDDLTPISVGSEEASFRMDRTFYEASGNLTPDSVTQEMVKDGDEWLLVLREDQVRDILSALEPPPAPEVTAQPLPEVTTEELPETTSFDPGEEDLFDCSDFITQEEAQAYLLPDDPYDLDADGDGVACEDLDEGSQYEAPAALPDPDPRPTPDPGSRRRRPTPTPSPAPAPGGDIDCDQVAGPIPTPPGDPDNLDGDGDGLACE